MILIDNGTSRIPIHTQAPATDHKRADRVMDSRRLCDEIDITRARYDSAMRLTAPMELLKVSAVVCQNHAIQAVSRNQHDTVGRSLLSVIMHRKNVMT
jgi:hypothetical protein